MKEEIEHANFVKLYEYCLKLIVQTAELFENDNNYKDVRIIKSTTNITVSSNFENVLKSWRVTTYNNKLSYGFKLSYRHIHLKGGAGELFIRIEYNTNKNCFYTDFFPLRDLTHTIDVKFVDDKKPEEVAQEIYNESTAFQQHHIQQQKGQDS
jgi:hypothetical protein